MGLTPEELEKRRIQNQRELAKETEADSKEPGDSYDFISNQNVGKVATDEGSDLISKD